MLTNSSLRSLLVRFAVLMLILSGLLFSKPAVSQPGYSNFKTAVYARSYEVRKMGDREWLDSLWTIIEAQVHVDKVYLETHRDLVMVQADTLEMIRQYFADRGIETSGGITLTVNERNRFQTFCYTDPGHRKKVKEIVEFTAAHFDEVILDDFFFTNCKCPLCIAAKGDRSWTGYRLDLMKGASRELILEPAKSVNPNVRVIIKYPNWYAHFQGLGFNLEDQPALFDGIYTGTETRNAYTSAQHLQPYHGYSIFRYFENIKPGANLGGWVDTGGSLHLDRYAEQLWLTLYAGAPEITLFDFRQVLRPVEDFEIPSWKGSFDHDEFQGTFTGDEPRKVARAAGYVFDKVDPLLGELGEPTGIKCYRPWHATGEDFLPSFLGMIGLPIELVPEFPAGDSMILLTASAAFDEDIVVKIEKQLLEGKSVTISSGLLDILQHRGLDNIAELRMGKEKALVSEYVIGRSRVEGTHPEILIPQVKYLTNDSWEVVSAIDGPNGWPVLHEAGYAGGSLFVLTIPDNYPDLYNIPEAVLNTIRAHVAAFCPIQLQGPSGVSIFLYNNGTLIVESFRDEPVTIHIATPTNRTTCTELVTGNESIEGIRKDTSGGWGQALLPARNVFELQLAPHSYRAFHIGN